MARTILETLRAVVDDPSDVDAVLSVMNKLADDVGEWRLIDQTMCMFWEYSTTQITA